jgi:hypothetical protein
MANRKNELVPFSNPVFTRHDIDTVTYNKIQRHLIDINDTITEEDIRNIKLFVPLSDLSVADLNESDREFIEGRKINSTWNVITE